MSHPVRGTVKDKLLVELVEADVEIGFSLIDDAKAYRASGQAELASRALQNAEAILADLERRLHDMGESASAPFQPLVAELRREIDGDSLARPKNEL